MRPSAALLLVLALAATSAAPVYDDSHAPAYPAPSAPPAAYPADNHAAGDGGAYHTSESTYSDSSSSWSTECANGECVTVTTECKNGVCKKHKKKHKHNAAYVGGRIVGAAEHAGHALKHGLKRLGKGALALGAGAYEGTKTAGHSLAQAGYELGQGLKRLIGNKVDYRAGEDKSTRHAEAYGEQQQQQQQYGPPPAPTYDAAPHQAY